MKINLITSNDFDGFIELTDYYNSKPVSIKISAIEIMFSYDGYTSIFLHSGSEFRVLETREHILGLIQRLYDKLTAAKNAGVII